MKTKSVFVVIWIVVLTACQSNENKTVKPSSIKKEIKPVIDCNYSFDEAIAGTKAPLSVINQLELINVTYLSMDGKIHQGQLLTNKAIAADLKEIFQFMLEQKFLVNQVIPIVKYNWDDEASMQADNSYSFCYRNVSYSKHSTGMAVDINPFQNPVRWEKEYTYRKNKPEGANYRPEVGGTFYPDHPVVKKFKSLGFFWGRYFSRNDDDHHFEK